MATPPTLDPAQRAAALAKAWGGVDENMYRQTFAQDLISIITTAPEFVYR